MVLFTYLKIILLQYFLVFNFSFQFSAVSKRTLNVYLSPCQSGPIVKMAKVQKAPIVKMAKCGYPPFTKSTYDENGKM